MKALVAGLLFIAALAACGSDRAQVKFKASDITGAQFGRDFQLTDHHGKKRSLKDFRGKVVVIFFGFTQCPDICPTTLAVLASALKQLGADAARVQGIFITIDPERDTADLLARYVPAFHSSFLGLYGDATETAKVAQEFKVIYEKRPSKTSSTYTMDHSAGTFIFDPQGRLRLYVSHGQSAEVFAHDIKLLLR